MLRNAVILLAVLGLCVLPACRTTCPTEAASDEPAAVTPSEKSSASSASPEDYRRARVQKAMRGLNYDSGLVEVDEEFAATIAERGDHAAALAEYQRGEELLQQNTCVEAVAAFTRAVLITPDDPQFYVGLGCALVSKGKDAEAAAAFRTGLQLDPASTELHFRLADVLNRLGELHAAIAEFRVVLGLSPDHGEAHSRLAVLLYYAGDEAGAWQHVHAAEAAEQTVPPQFLLLLKGEMPAAPIRTGSRLQIGEQVRIDVNGGTWAANETTMATTDQDPMEVVGAWNDWRDSTTYNEIIRMGVAVSLDGGETWTDFLVRPPAQYQSSVEGDPMTCYDHRTGTLWVGAISFAGNGGVFTARKVPGSTTFEPSVMARATGSADKGWMAAGADPDDPDKTRAYIGYNQGMLRSTDMGDTWQGPVSMGYGLGFLPRVGPNGELYAAYWDMGDGVKLKRSYNGGLSFTTHHIATRMDVWGTQSGSRFPGRFRVPSLNYIAVDPNDGTLYCVYFDTTGWVGGNANVDLYFTKSTDQGTTWTTPVVINEDADPPGDQYWPWLEVDRNGVIHMLFYDSRNVVQDDDDEHGMFDAYYSISSDRGETWTEYRLTPESFDSYYDGLPRYNQFLGDYNGLGLAGSRVYPCYLSTQNLDSDIFVNVILLSLLGDVNCDGEVNFGDINPFVLAMNDPDLYEQLYPDCPFENRDINGDGVFDFNDVNPFVALLSQ